MPKLINIATQKEYPITQEALDKMPIGMQRAFKIIKTETPRPPDIRGVSGTKMETFRRNRSSDRKVT